MEDKKLLKGFYTVVDELEKNIIKFNELEDKLEKAKKENDIKLAKQLLVEYKKVSKDIEALKGKCEKLNS